MAFLEYLRRRLWVVPMLATVAFIATDTVIHLRVTYSISKEHPSPAPMPDNASPTGYAEGQRDIILPYTGMDGYHWVMQTQQMLAEGEPRIRHVDYDNYDNGPKGREMHWSSSFRWWVAGLAWLEHAYAGVPLSISVEQVMPFANTLLIVLLVILVAPFVVRRFGLGAGSLFIVGIGAILPVYESFAEGKSDHHGLASLSSMLTLLFLLGGGAGWIRNGDAASAAGVSPFLDWLPERAQAKRWFIASGIVGGIGLWVSTASEAPVLAEIGLAALVATGWLGYNTTPEEGARPDPSLWRVWGWAGAATSIFFYLLEYFPSHFGLRLEVNHPLYAATWAGGGEIVFRICRWWNGGKLAEEKRDWLWLAISALAVATVPTLVYFFASKVFWVADRFLFLFHEDYIAEFKDVRRYLDPMYATGSAKYLMTVLNPLPLLAVPMVVWMWRQLRTVVLASVAVGLPLCGALYWFHHLHATTRVDFVKDYLPLLLPAGLLAFAAATICLLKPQWEKITLLAALGLGLLGYDLFLLLFQHYLAAHAQDWPSDYYFWPFETVPLAVIAGLLALWEPWGDFPRPAKAVMMLSLPPTLITLALSIREMRWMEIDYALWLATIVGVVVIVGRQRNYRWSMMPLAILTGLTTIILGELELHWEQLSYMQTAGAQAAPELAMHDAPHLAVLVMSTVAILVVLGMVAGRILEQSWSIMARAALFLLLPPTMLALLIKVAQLHWLHPDWVPWLDIDWVPWVAAILAIAVALSLQSGYHWKVMARTFVATVFIGAVFLPSPVLTMVDWLGWIGAVPMSDVEMMEIVTRDVSQRLRAQLGDQTGVVVSGPTTTTWMTYWGGFKGLGTLYWENLEGLKADRDIYAAPTPEEALKLIKERGVTHIAIFSWDPFYKEYARLAINKQRPYNPDEYQGEKPMRDWLDYVRQEHEPPLDEVDAEKPLIENAFVYSLIENFKIPNWLRPVYYPMPSDRQLRGNYVIIFEVVPPQKPEEAATRLAKYQMLRGYPAGVINSLNLAFQANRNYLPAFICAARFDSDRNNKTEFQGLMRNIRLLLPLADPLSLEDCVDLAMDFVLDGDNESAKQQILAGMKIANAQNLRRLNLDQLYNFLSFMRQTGVAEARPGLRGFIFDLLPDAQRSLYLLESGRAQKQTDPAGALVLFRRALIWQADSAPALTELAKLLATDHDASLRNGKEALATALRASDLVRNQSYEVNDVLACAYAENGQFTSAENVEREAIRQAENAYADAIKQQAGQQAAIAQADSKIYRAHLELFNQNQPFHE